MFDSISWNQDWHLFAAGFFLAYLLGSIPFGLLLTKLSGAGDIRQVGSGNIGATNVLRTGGKTLGVATLLLDAAKGFVAVLVCLSLVPDFAVIAAWGAVLGHLFPVWLKFRGGKGFATTLGVLFGLAPLLGVFACLTWLVVAVAFRYSSLATLAAVVAVPFYAWFMGQTQLAVVTAVLAVLLALRHHANIRRLLTGQEPNIGANSV